MATPHMYWSGSSGKRYKYWIYSMKTPFDDRPGNFIYVRKTAPNRWRPLYIGQTASMRHHLPGGETRECLTHNWPTHIHMHINVAGEAARNAEKADLVDRWKPHCNSRSAQ